MGNDIISSLLKDNTPILINSRIGMFKLSIGHNNELELQVPNDFVFKILGDLNISIEGELNIDSSELNIVTYGNDINLDSADANIHLNSCRAKQIKNIPKYRDKMLEQKKETDEQYGTNSKKSNNKKDIYDMLGDILKRLSVLEERDKTTINLTKDGLNSYVMQRFDELRKELEHDD